MIPANELRAGNLVMGPPLSIPRLSIQSTGWVALTAYGILLIDRENLEYNPIPLTMEVLAQCGFKSPYYGGQRLDFWQPDLLRNFPVFSIYKAEEDAPMFIKMTERTGHSVELPLPDHIKHLHQLQNLYFDLSGKELSYTPPSPINPNNPS